VDVASYSQSEPFTTLDGSQIREWAGKVSMPQTRTRALPSERVSERP
jgi:hypothetical protein